MNCPRSSDSRTGAIFPRLSGLLLALLVCLAQQQTLGGDALPVDVANALTHAKRYMVYSLDPAARAKGAGFHDYRIVGIAPVDDAATRLRIAAALRRDISAPGAGALCFEPRRGLRVIGEGAIYDLVICYECGHVQIHSAGVRPRYLAIRGDPKELDEVLAAGKIDLVPSRLEPAKPGK